MANRYEIGTATSLDDLIRTKLRNFATATLGYTDDEGTSAAGRQYLSRSGGGLSLFFSCRFDTGTPQNLGLYQALGYINAGTQPGNHTSDSGNGIVTSTNATFVTGRSVVLANTSMNYWFFGDGAASNYVHVVVEPTPGSGSFRHFGFGLLGKVGTWTGGEYCYGHRTATAGSVNVNNSYLLDGLNRASAANPPFVATLHIESLPLQVASGKWGVVWGDRNTARGNDRGGTAREAIQGGFRGGPVAFPFAKWGNTPSQGLVPLTPIWCFYTKDGGAGDDRCYPLGFMRDTRAININSYSGGDQISVGGDTWILFPSEQKGTNTGASTGNQGIAYKLIAN